MQIIGEQEKDVYVGCNKYVNFILGSSGKSSRPLQWAGYISQHLEQKVHLSTCGLLQKKQAGWLKKCLFKYFTEVRFVLKILENSKVIASELP